MNQPWIYVCSPSRSPLPPPSPPDSSGSSQCTRTCLMHPTWAGDLFPVYVFIHSFLFAMCPHLQGPYKMCPIVPSELVMWVPPSAMPFLWKCCDPLPPGSPVTGRICQQLAKEEYESSRLCEVLDVCEFFFRTHAGLTFRLHIGSWIPRRLWGCEEAPTSIPRTEPWDSFLSGIV